MYCNYNRIYYLYEFANHRNGLIADFKPLADNAHTYFFLFLKSCKICAVIVMVSRNKNDHRRFRFIQCCANTRETDIFNDARKYNTFYE